MNLHPINSPVMDKEVKILLVEDLESDALLAEIELKKNLHRFSLQVVDNAKDLTASLIDYQPDVVITDYNLPSFNGMEALKIVMKMSPVTPVIIFTGSLNEDIAVECMKAGATDYVIKEHLKRLGHAVKSALEQKEIGQQKAEAQQMLAESEKKYRTLYETMSQGVVYLDNKGIIISANRSAERILNAKASQLTGNSLEGLLQFAIGEDGSPFPYNQCPSYISLTTGKKSQATLGLLNPETKSYTWANVISMPQFRDGEDKPYQVYTTLEDITRMKKLLIELNNLNQVLEEKVRQRAQELIRLSNLQKAILGNAGLAIVATNATGTIQLFNPAAEKLLGYSAEEMIGKASPAVYLIPEEIQERALKLAEKGRKSAGTGMFSFYTKLSQNEAYTDEWTFVRKDGSRFPARLTVSTYNDVSENFAGYIGIFMDITAEKKALEALHRSEAENRLILDAVPDMLFKVDSQGIFHFAHFTGTSIPYMPPEQFMGKSINEVLPEEVASLSKRMLQKALDTREVVSFEYSLPNKEGISYFENRMIALSDTEILSIIRDVTKRTMAVEALQRSELFLKMMTVNSPLGFLVVDNTTDETLFYNPKYIEIWGIGDPGKTGRLPLKYKDLVDMSKYLVQDPESYEQMIEKLGNVEVRDEVKETIALKDDKYLSMHSTQIRGQKDEYYGRLFIFEDITAKEKLANSLKEAVAHERKLNEVKSRFVTMASHEFRTPIASILMASETLLAYYDRLNRDNINKHLWKINHNIQFLREIINKFLDLSKIELGKIPFTPERVKINEFISQWHEDFKTRQTLQHRLTINGNGVDDPVSVDRQLMTQVLDNLVSNSLKYSPPQTEVVINAERITDRVIVSISDHGIGIPQEDVEKLFQPFFRASNVQKLQGTGLGMPLCKQVIEHHQGQIWVKSALNEGTTVYFSLPCDC